MRLSQIRLAGFKTFVDPTTIHIPGNIVGIVGPNGCGKSNVIDALRWVLGESKAASLRGKSMQDVIFSGSAQRKPVARASVELVFDNSLGRAAGQWSQYAEIAVKRVLQRDAESAYYINNTRVRRRDVADIFLGTGLGGNAYAIIEQGMISRIIEADPAELKVFLEEAAGISRYRERRRETESHLAATRENLSRVDDLKREIVERIVHLESQASVAKLYRELDAQLKRARNLLWLGKKIQAAETRRKLAESAEKTETEIAEMGARLRGHEARLVEVREQHEDAGRALQEAQGLMYQANAEVSGLQKEIDHLKAARAKLETRIAASKIDLEGLDRQHGETQQAIVDAQRNLESFRTRHETHDGELERCRRALEAASAEASKARQAFDEARQAASGIEQEARIMQAHQGHAANALAQAERRRRQLESSRAALPEIDPAGLAGIDDALSKALEDGSSARRAASESASRLEAARAARRDAYEKLREAEREFQETGARLGALEDVQKGLDGAASVQDWLKRRGLDGAPRLWAGLSVEEGWEMALESVLRERLHAICRDPGSDIPPGEAVFARTGALRLAAHPSGFQPLLSRVGLTDPAFGAALSEWLSGVYVAADLEDGVARAAKLAHGECLVTPEGHLVTAHSIHYYGPDTRLHGVLARQMEIARLRDGKRDAGRALEAARAVQRACESEFSRIEASLREANAAASKLDRERHELQLKRVKVFEANERARQQSDRIDAELAEIGRQHEADSAKLKDIERNLEAISSSGLEAQSALAAAREGMTRADAAREACSARLREIEKMAQESLLGEKSAAIRLEELGARLDIVSRNRIQAEAALGVLGEEFSQLDAAPLNARLEEALALREAREAGLSRARDQSETLSAELKACDRLRQESEFAIGPLRERLSDLRLKEQEARLGEEQFEAQLKEAGAKPEELLSEPLPKSSALQAEITGLQGRIESLGAVNLAAFEELESAQARCGYIESQHADLSEAVETLEGAIRKIDRETRDRLMKTYDEVNVNLGELFVQLFGGGRARLVLTGEQIIDSGLEIEAQPPGKKNASIRLLSGGEKALVALSLVFSLFRLNPAPFCLLDEVDAPLDDSNTERFCAMVRKMAENTQFLFISHNRITMEIAHQLIGVTMQEQGVSRIVAVDVEKAFGQNGIMAI